MAIEKQEGKQNPESDIQPQPKKVDAKKRFASGMARAGRGQLPAKDSLEGV